MFPKVTVADGASGRRTARWDGTGMGRISGFGGGNAMVMALFVGVLDFDWRLFRAKGVKLGAISRVLFGEG